MNKKRILSVDLLGLSIAFAGWLTGIKPVQLIGTIIVIATTGFVIYEMDQLERARERQKGHKRGERNTKRLQDDYSKLY